MAEPCDNDRVLVVDDEPTIRRLFSAVIGADSPDLVVDSASNGLEAVAMFEEKHPRVIVLDLHMPVMDGQRAFTEIQKKCAEKDWDMPSIIFCTGFVPPSELVQEIEASSIHTLLRKPVTASQIMEAIKESRGS